MPEKNSKNGDGQDKGNGKKEEEPGVFKGLATLSSMGIAMVVSTLIGLLIGIYLDKVFSTKPWFTIIFLILGIAAGFKNIYEMIKKYGSTGG
ncbi:MAG: AtpZ/AtpI family protein [Deltaproteobacteria bacterium]|nr:AtpZ/AtpI family protein [Deltaproteobacteria bacterium]